MLDVLSRTARRVWHELLLGWRRPAPLMELTRIARRADVEGRYRPLERVVLTDGVARTLFDEYAQHRAGERGDEETGWMLLGHRREKEALALATLPAGTLREAGVAHVRFNSTAQAVGSRIVRQEDRQLAILGVVHTHPGSLRHPSHGDYQGDRAWVGLLRGGEAAFGIGTADGVYGDNPLVAVQLKRHSHCYLGLRFSWYALGEEDKAYRPLPVRLTIGPDLARPLHDAWTIIEAHAPRLEQLCKRLARVRLEVRSDEKGPALHVAVPLESDEESLRVVLREKTIEYYLVRKGEWLVSDSREPNIDRGVYLMLAALANREA